MYTEILIYHGPAENFYKKKIAKFHFTFKTASSEESTMEWREPW